MAFLEQHSNILGNVTNRIASLNISVDKLTEWINKDLNPYLCGSFCRATFFRTETLPHLTNINELKDFVTGA